MEFGGNWRFESPGSIPDEVQDEFLTLISRISGQGNSWAILEHFKRYFASAAGWPQSESSSERWAESDLRARMSASGTNAALFIEAFYEGSQELGRRGLQVPDVKHLNRILSEHGAGYKIDPPRLVAVGDHQPIPVPGRLPSLDEQGQSIISGSLEIAERLLREGQPRQAVQEILWMLETAITAFRGLSTGGVKIEEKYFNKIAGELKRHLKGTTLEQVLSWIERLHGYLSSPTGGGIRHGVDLQSGVVVSAEEARLYCNLIRSYVVFLMTEHQRLSNADR